MSHRSQLVPLGSLASIIPGLVTSGAGAGARRGSWAVQEVSLKDIQDDRIVRDGIESISIEFKAATEKHLLRPFDVLITARSTIVKSALVPPSLTPAVANSTLTVVRPKDPDLSPFLWWFFTSRHGRAQIESRMVGSTVMLLRAGALRDIEVPVPPLRDLRIIADIVQASERAREAALEAAQIRHETVRDRIVEDLLSAAALADVEDVRAENEDILSQEQPVPGHPMRIRDHSTATHGDTDATH